MNLQELIAEVISPAAGANSPRGGEGETRTSKGSSPLSPDSPLSGATAGNALSAEISALVDRLKAAGSLAPGDDALIAEMHGIDPEGTAWLLRDMLLRARAGQ